MLATDLSKFDPYKCPKTQSLARAAQEVADVEVGFMIDMATTLEFWDHDEEGYLKTETLVPSSVLRDQFFEYAKRRRLNSRGSDTALGMKWVAVGFVGGRKCVLAESTWINGTLRTIGFRANAYKLPDPQEMRDKLIAEHGLPTDCFKDAAKIRRLPPKPEAPLEPDDRATGDGFDAEGCAKAF